MYYLNNFTSCRPIIYGVVVVLFLLTGCSPVVKKTSSQKEINKVEFSRILSVEKEIDFFDNDPLRLQVLNKYGIANGRETGFQIPEIDFTNNVIYQLSNIRTDRIYFKDKRLIIEGSQAASRLEVIAMPKKSLQPGEIPLEVYLVGRLAKTGFLYVLSDSDSEALTKAALDYIFAQYKGNIKVLESITVDEAFSAVRNGELDNFRKQILVGIVDTRLDSLGDGTATLTVRVESKTDRDAPSSGYFEIIYLKKVDKAWKISKMERDI